MDEADAVTVRYGQGHGLVEFVGKLLGERAEQSRQPDGGQIGVAEFHQARRQDDAVAVEPEVAHACQGGGDPVDGGAGEAGGAYELAHGHHAVGLADDAQHGDAAHQRPHGFGGCRVVGRRRDGHRPSVRLRSGVLLTSLGVPCSR